MALLRTTLGLMSYGFLLCVGLSTAVPAGHAASVANQLNTDQTDRRPGGHMRNEMNGGHTVGSKTIKGAVVGVQGNNIIVKGEDGKEVWVHTDNTTQMGKNIEQGERIEARVNAQNHALSILSAQAVTDRRNDKE
jgi:hypothetical protein